jgi:hypothetical protein
MPNPSNLSRTRRSIAKAAAMLVGSIPALALVSRGATGQDGHGNGHGGGTRCFLRGTRIRTLTGYKPVECLSVGETIPTLFSGPAPIREIRHFRHERKDRNQPWPASAIPVRIRASAIADNIPKADLYVSAPHSLYIDGVLVPAWNLINGASITRDCPEHLDAIEYFHVILDQHDVIDAEGASCDTYWEAIDYIAASADCGDEIHGAILPEVCAPLTTYRRRRNVIKSRLRSALSPVIDLRRPLDRIRDRIEERRPC